MAECFHHSLNRENTEPQELFTEANGGNKEKAPRMQPQINAELTAAKRHPSSIVPIYRDGGWTKSAKTLQEKTEGTEICLKTAKYTKLFYNRLATGSRFIGVYRSHQS